MVNQWYVLFVENTVRNMMIAHDGMLIISCHYFTSTKRLMPMRESKPILSAITNDPLGRIIHHIFELDKKAELFDGQKQIFGSPKINDVVGGGMMLYRHFMRECVFSLRKIGSRYLNVFQMDCQCRNCTQNFRCGINMI